MIASLINRIRYNFSNNSIEKNFLILILYFLILFLIGFITIKKEGLIRNQIYYLNNINQEANKVFVTEIEESIYKIKNLSKVIEVNKEKNLKEIQEIFHNRHNEEISCDKNMHRIFWINKNNDIQELSNNIDGISKINISKYINLIKNQKNEPNIAISKIFDEKNSQISIIKNIFNNNDYEGSLLINIDINQLIKQIIDTEIDYENLKIAIIDDEYNIIAHSDNFSIDNDKQIIKEHQNKTTITAKGFLFRYSKASQLKNIKKYPFKILLIHEITPKTVINFIKNLDIVESNFYKIQLLTIFIFTVIAIIYIRKTIIGTIISLERTINSVSKRKNVNIPDYHNIEIKILASSLKGLKNILETQLELKKQISYEQRRVEELRKEKNEMVGSVCHDLKNHIFAVSGLLDLINKELQNNNIDKNELIRVIAMIYDQISLLQNFAEEIQVKKSNNQQQNKHQNQIEEFNGNNVIKQIIDSFVSKIIQENISIKLTLSDNIPNILCNQKHFRQIFTNLISNSVKYSNQNSTITIASSYNQKAKIVEIIIADQGIGMTEDELQKMLNGQGFDIEKKGLNKPFESQGIGMKNVQRLLNLNNGKLEVQSQKNVGTTFRIKFSNVNLNEFKTSSVKKLNITENNIQINDSKNITNRSKEEITEILSKSKILVIDDQATNLMIIGKIFAGYNCNILRATNNEELIAIYELNKNSIKPIDLIISDINLGNENSCDAIKKIRISDQKTKAICFTGDGDQNNIQEYLKCGFDDYFIKGNQSFQILIEKSIMQLIDKNKQDF